MKKRRQLTAVFGLFGGFLMVAVMATVSPVQAGVVVDGSIGAGEYTYTIADPGGNEPGVPDGLDMMSGHIAGGDSLYLGWELYAPYDLNGEDDSYENFLRVSIDYNNDNVTDFRVRIDGNDTIGSVYRGTVGTTDLAGTFNTLTLIGQPEAAVGWDLFTLVDGGDSVFTEGMNTFQVRWRVDGGGDSADDSILTSTTWQSVSINMQTIPEPATISLVALVLAVGFCVRRWYSS